MAELFPRLVKRNLGLIEVIQPVIPVSYAPAAEPEPISRLGVAPDEVPRMEEEQPAFGREKNHDTVSKIEFLSASKGREENESDLSIEPESGRSGFPGVKKAEFNSVEHRTLSSTHIPPAKLLPSSEIRRERSSPSTFKPALEGAISLEGAMSKLGRAGQKALISAYKQKAEIENDMSDNRLPGKKSSTAQDTPFPDRYVEEPPNKKPRPEESIAGFQPEHEILRSQVPVSFDGSRQADKANQGSDHRPSRPYKVQAQVIRPAIPERQASHQSSVSSRGDIEPKRLGEPPTIKVHIGRVEVRAIMGQVPKPRKAVPSGPRLSLEDYLKKYSTGSR